MVKQTERNNKFLAGVKRLVNHKDYINTLRIFNTEGSDAALTYLKPLFKNPDAVNYKLFEFFSNFNGLNYHSFMLGEGLRKNKVDTSIDI